MKHYFWLAFPAAATTAFNNSSTKDSRFLASKSSDPRRSYDWNHCAWLVNISGDISLSDIFYYSFHSGAQTNTWILSSGNFKHSRLHWLPQQHVSTLQIRVQQLLDSRSSHPRCMTRGQEALRLIVDMSGDISLPDVFKILVSDWVFQRPIFTNLCW